jgi:hypothetical protein
VDARAVPLTAAAVTSVAIRLAERNANRFIWFSPCFLDERSPKVYLLG